MREPALIFDFGNVVAFFDYLKACERLGPRLGMTALAFRQRIVERGFASLLGRFERGKIAPEEFAAGVMALSGLTLPYQEFVDAWQDIFWLNEPVARLIERAQVGRLHASPGLEHQYPALHSFPAPVRVHVRPARPSCSFTRSWPHETERRVLPCVCRGGGPAGRLVRIH